MITILAASTQGDTLDFGAMLFVFMLATFIGVGVIRRVSRLLHTPLMSLTNAISAIAVVGAIIVAGAAGSGVVGEEYPLWMRLMGATALLASMINIISGFLITDRMLKMFRTRGAAPVGGASGAPPGPGGPAGGSTDGRSGGVSA